MQENPALPVQLKSKNWIIMKKNMGNIDKGLRILFAVLIGVLYATGVINGTAAIILGVLSVIFILTSMVSFCPLYAPFGLSTRKKTEGAS